MLLLALFLCFPFANARVPSATEIPGCPDVTSLTKSIDDLEHDQLDQIKCVCLSRSEQEDGEAGEIQVNCVFGSNLDDLSRVLEAISELNRTVFHINLNHVGVSNTTRSLAEMLETTAVSRLSELEIRNCHGGSLPVGSEGKDVELSELRTMTIESCELDGFPAVLVRNSPLLAFVSLSKNKLEAIKRNDLESLSESLEYLDLTENLINEVEEGAFKQLGRLKTLLIGEHNSAHNNTLLSEVIKMKNLETLDLTRIDGIEEAEQLQFAKNNRLKRLILTGCNLKRLNESSFPALDELQDLDLRVNLIDSLAAGSFLELKDLRRLNLAGNFLREAEIRAEAWTGLQQLEELDLGWNEVRRLNSNAFGPDLGQNLRLLSLRSNEKLKDIQAKAFKGLVYLRTLNLSGSSLSELRAEMLVGLEKLEVLDLSRNNISVIEADALKEVNGTLTTLRLNGNNLTSLPVGILRHANLTEVDLSDNPWSCDRRMLEIAQWIKERYSDALKDAHEFLLAGAANTTCSRPYRLSGRNLMELGEEEVDAVYDEKADTTTAALPAESTTIAAAQEDNSTINIFDLSKFSLNVGETNETFEVNVDEGKPTYNINEIRYGQRPVKNSTNTWVSAVVVSLLLVVTAVGVVLVVRRKKAHVVRTNSTNSQRITSSNF